MSENKQYPGEEQDSRSGASPDDGQYGYPQTGPAQTGQAPGPAAEAAPSAVPNGQYPQNPGTQAPPAPGYGQQPQYGQAPGGQFGQAPYSYPQGQNGHMPYGQGYMEQKSRLVAGLLGIFIGSLGIHRFYLGHTGIGIAQIAVSVVTFGIGGIWGFIEGIMILCNTQSFRADARGIPLKE